MRVARCAHSSLIALGTCLALLANTDPSQATDRHLAASSGRAARQEAIRAIPLAQLETSDRAAVQAVLHHTSVYRRLPTQMVDCPPDLFTFLMRHPHTIANIWEVLDMSKLRMARIADRTYQADDGNGTRGTLQVIWEKYGQKTQHQILFYGKGTYDGKPFLRPIPIRCVFLFRSQAVPKPHGTHTIQAQLDSFVAIDQTGLDLLARTIHPLVGQMADHNFTETMRFVSSFSKAAKKNPSGVELLAHRLTHLTPELRQELVTLVHDGVSDYRYSQPARPASHTVLNCPQ